MISSAPPQDRHKLAVQKIVQQLLANDDIYLGGYEGWYDEGQEEFVTETEAKANEVQIGHQRPAAGAIFREELFFPPEQICGRACWSTSRRIPEFIQPESRRNEVISKLKAGVEDLSISRATLKWGIPMPNDPEHVVYVWIDALSNYITALGYGSDRDECKFEQISGRRMCI